MVSILHHGAVNGVTGSCHQLVLDSDTSVLIDCGLFQGAESRDRQFVFLFNIRHCRMAVL